MRPDPRRRIHVPLTVVLLCHLIPNTLIAQTGYFGTARVNINPALPIRLSGYAGRTTEATSIAQNLYATAAAFGTGADTAVLIAVDCTGFRDNVTDVVSASLSQSAGIPQERISFTSTHTHNGPCVDGYLTNLFGAPLPAAQQQRVEQYTQLLTGRLEEVALEALANRSPGHTITWGTGSVSFGQNRRGAGIVDHDLPVIRVADSAGNTKSIITSYAAHAVALSNNGVSGDWPGYAREALEALYPGATALVMIGAAGDINPSPLGSTASAQSNGQSVANEVQRLVNNSLLEPVTSTIRAAHGFVALPFATARQPGDPANARLAPAGTQDHAYEISTWTFGDEIAMVFLEGEVVVDYSLRLKSHFGDGRMWVNAYSNDIPGYIPSERILFEGGYEADDSGFYYALPGRFAHGLEDKIVDEVVRQLSPFFNPLDRLRLRVDRTTGGATIVNEWTGPISFDAYTIVSQDGVLSGSWNSLSDQGVEGWEEADNLSPRRVSEFNPRGQSTLASAGAIQLGTPFVFPAPPAFGIEPPPDFDVDLEFEYTIPGGQAIRGLVEFAESDGRRNNLVLTIDPSTGEAAIQNESPYFDVAISAYTLTSASGRLRTNDGLWNSFEDQGLSGWEQADNATAFRLTEFNPADATLIAGGGVALLLGAPVDIAGDPLELDDFAFEFLLSSGEIMDGVVELGLLPGTLLPGDYDQSGVVDPNDYNFWRATFGQSSSPGVGADGNSNGTIDAADYVVWKKSMASAAAVAHHAVPEPQASVVIAVLLVVCAAQPATCRSRNYGITSSKR
ncbi:MAG TPA: hypothetical protein VJ828_00110 [Lacipirellulaceae bacterium]|nr:hypothetical protein [Lacipirellulaceae bacterium]